jgi:hypothetical protein
MLVAICCPYVWIIHALKIFLSLVHSRGHVGPINDRFFSGPVLSLAYPFSLSLSFLVHPIYLLFLINVLQCLPLFIAPFFLKFKLNYYQ